MSKNSKSSATAILGTQESPGHTSLTQQPQRTYANVVKLGNQTSPTASVSPTRRPSCQPSPDPITVKIGILVEIASNQMETLRITLGKFSEILHQQQQQHPSVLYTLVDIITNQQMVISNHQVNLSEFLGILHQQQPHQSVVDIITNEQLTISNQQITLSRILEVIHQQQHQQHQQQQQHHSIPKIIYLKEFDVSEEVTI
jgi:hypothetical protein